MTITHVVKRGETISSIAQRYFGNPSKWIDIWQANANRIISGTPNNLPEGVSLIITLPDSNGNARSQT